MRIAASQVVLGDGSPARELTLEVEGERVVAVHEGATGDAELFRGMLVPGFVDTHCHGGAGADFSDPDPDRVCEAIELHRSHGTTTLFASTVTESMDELLAQVGRLRPLVEAGELAGIHLEGPFLSPAKKGAHQEDLLCDPTPERIRAILDAAQGSVRMVTLAPEREHSDQAIQMLREAGVVVAFGHSDADWATTRRSVAQGATVATHLFNAMRPVHHREPGPVPVLLNDPRVAVELICDGVHLHHEVVRMAVDAAGVDRVMLVTDAMSATGSPDGRYELGSLPVHVHEGVARIVLPDGTPGAIAGSTLTMDRAFAFLGECGFDWQQASAMSSTVPARVHGLDGVGTLTPGGFADLCHVDADSGGLAGVMRRGQWLEGPTGAEEE